MSANFNTCQLPAPALKLIFGFLGTRDAAQLSGVCRHFREFALGLGPRLSAFRKVDHRFQDAYHWGLFMRFLGSMSGIAKELHVKILYEEELDRAALNAMPTLHGVTLLNFSGNIWLKKEHLNILAGKCPSVASLNLNECSGVGVEDVYRIVHHHWAGQLGDLNFRHFTGPWMPPDYLGPLLNLLAEEIIELDVQGTCLSWPMERTTNIIERNPGTLTKLCLNQVSATAPLLAALSTCTRLTTLSIDFQAHPFTYATRICDCLRSLPRLQHLHVTLVNHSYTAHFHAEWHELWSNAPFHLKRLALRVDPPALIPSLASLLAQPALEALALRNPVQPGQLLPAVPFGNRLRALRIVGDYGALDIRTLLYRLPLLTRFSINTSCAYIDKWASWFSSTFPTCAMNINNSTINYPRSWVENPEADPWQCCMNIRT